MTITQTDYYQEAFGGFEQYEDPDAAVKFCLNIIAMGHAFSRLIRLLDESTNVGGISGVPGWLLERRNEGDTRGYEHWPSGALFRASVDPDDYELGFPEGFYTAPAFAGFVHAILRAYVARHPDRAAEAERVIALLPR